MKMSNGEGTTTVKERNDIAAEVRRLAEDIKTPGWGDPAKTDPTKLTQDAVDRSSAQWEQRLLSEVQILVTRLEAMDTATTLNAQRLNEWAGATEKQHEHLREDFDRQVQALKELQAVRIDGMDKATKLLADNVAKIPSDIDRAVEALRIELKSDTHNVQEVSAEKFQAIEGTFASNALALTAALAAQKEAAAEQNKSNTLAIDRANSTTKETIAANAAQFTNSLASQAATIADLKDRVVRIESGGVATKEAQSENLTARHSDATFTQAEQISKAATQRATMGLMISAIIAVIGIIAFVLSVAHP
jgi:hypothetical protein